MLHLHCTVTHAAINLYKSDYDEAKWSSKWNIWALAYNSVRWDELYSPCSEEALPCMSWAICFSYCMFYLYSERVCPCEQLHVWEVAHVVWILKDGKNLKNINNNFFFFKCNNIFSSWRWIDSFFPLCFNFLCWVSAKLIEQTPGITLIRNHLWIKKSNQPR